MRIHRGFDLDPSCKLWLPFYKYGLEQTKIWDMSGNNNHGTITGATPASYPVLSGVELVTNGGFTDTTGWSAVNSTLAAIAGGQSGNCLEVTRTVGSLQGAYGSLSTVVGKRYKLSGWTKSGSSGAETYIIVATDGDGTPISSQITGTSSASWAYGEVIFTATTTTSQAAVYKSSETAGTMLFDSISVQEVTGYQSVGWQCDGVDDEINVADSTSLRMGMSNFTVLQWVRILGGPEVYYLFRKVTGGEYRMYLYNYSIPGATTRIFLNDGVNTIDAVAALTVDAIKNQWALIGVVVNRTTNVANSTINGVLSPDVNIATLVGNVNPTGPLYISSGGGAGYAPSTQGNFRILNRALSAIELKNYYESTRHIFGV